MTYTDNDIEDYGDYLIEVSERIIILNNRIKNNIHIDNIEIDEIKRLSNDEWGFKYKIYKGNLPEPTKKAIGPIVGTIRYQSFNIWMAIKMAERRDEKLKQLGI